MKFRLFLLALVASVLIFPACNEEEDPTLQERLVGEWDVYSYTEDGTELINFIIQAFTIRLDEYEGSEGDFRFSVTYSDGSAEIVDGFYTVNEENETLRLEDSSGDVTRFDIELENENRVTFSGNIDGVSTIVKADRQ